jgi:hypothetical protein
MMLSEMASVALLRSDDSYQRVGEGEGGQRHGSVCTSSGVKGEGRLPQLKSWTALRTSSLRKGSSASAPA